MFVKARKSGGGGGGGGGDLLSLGIDMAIEESNKPPVIKFKNKDSDADVKVKFQTGDLDWSATEFEITIQPGTEFSGPVLEVTSWEDDKSETPMTGVTFSNNFTVSNVRSGADGKPIADDTEVANVSTTVRMLRVLDRRWLISHQCNLKLDYSKVKKDRTIKFRAGEDYLPSCPGKAGVDIVCTGINGVKGTTCPRPEETVEAADSKAPTRART